MSAPRVVDTPEKAARYARGLGRDALRLAEVLAEAPEWWDDLPADARAELDYRLMRLARRIDEFKAARDPVEGLTPMARMANEAMRRAGLNPLFVPESEWDESLGGTEH